MNESMRRAVAIVAFVSAGPLLAQGTYMGDAQIVRPAPPVSQPPGYAPPPSTPVYAPAPGYATPAPADANFAQDELDSLLAPIALYPDQLLAQVLMAATFPLDVVEAARFVQQNPNLKGQALDNALASRSWDPSVLSLTAFPSVLVMMNDRLDWTRRVGDAFLADQDHVMETVQDLRQRAQAAGNLMDTPQQHVVVENRAIYIEPAQPDVIYVPTYNPTIVYGPWWAPAYVPYYWRPPRAYYPAIVGAGVIGFSGGYYVTGNHWGWARPDWRSRRVAIDLGRRNYFIERRPYYREWVREGWWQHRGEAWRGSRNGRPVVNTVPDRRRDGGRPWRGEGTRAESPRPEGPRGPASRLEARESRPGAVDPRSMAQGGEAGSGPAPRPQRLEAPRARPEPRSEGARPQRAPEAAAPGARPARPEGGSARNGEHRNVERREAQAPRAGNPAYDPGRQQQ